MDWDKMIKKNPIAAVLIFVMIAFGNTNLADFGKTEDKQATDSLTQVTDSLRADLVQVKIDQALASAQMKAIKDNQIRIEENNKINQIRIAKENKAAKIEAKKAMDKLELKQDKILSLLYKMR